MPSITPESAVIKVTGDVDTHLDTHTAAVIDHLGRIPGTQQFPATTAGYIALPAWMRGFGDLGRVGIEGTGACGTRTRPPAARPENQATDHRLREHAARPG
jgi:transposase